MNVLQTVSTLFGFLFVGMVGQVLGGLEILLVHRL